MTKNLAVDRMDEELLWDALRELKYTIRTEMNKPQNEDQINVLNERLERAMKLQARLVEL